LSGIHRQKRQGKLAGRVEVINGYATTIMWPLTTVFLHPHLGESGIIYIYLWTHARIDGVWGSQLVIFFLDSFLRLQQVTTASILVSWKSPFLSSKRLSMPGQLSKIAKLGYKWLNNGLW
jgi:hypothetical protein